MKRLILIIAITALIISAGCISAPADSGIKVTDGSINGILYLGCVAPISETDDIIFITTKGGFIGCGGFNVSALDAFDVPAVKVPGVSSVEDLLNKPVTEANKLASQLGVTVGMTGEEALIKMNV